MYFWTANPRQGSGLQRTVGAAVGDEDMFRWRKLTGNPIMGRGRHGDPDFAGEWDAPFLFTEQGRTFMILSALQDGDPVLPLYEAENPELTRWAYRGIMFRTSRSEVREIECQNFARIGDRWVLLHSPDDTQMRYYAGRFDLDSLTFTPETSGIVDHAYGPDNDSGERGFYARYSPTAAAPSSNRCTSGACAPSGDGRSSGRAPAPVTLRGGAGRSPAGGSGRRWRRSTRPGGGGSVPSVTETPRRRRSWPARRGPRRY